MMPDATANRLDCLLFFEGLQHRYKKQNRDHSVCFKTTTRYEFRSGDITVLYGHSGSGKSTLLNLLGGLDCPADGNLQIMWDIGTPACNMRVPRDHRGLAHYRRHKISYLFQDGGLIEELDVLQNVMLPLRYASIARNERRARCEQALERVGLADKRDKDVSQLSGGERHRVGLARVIARQAEIVICDEPTAALDKETSLLVRDILREEAAHGGCIFIATHDPILIEDGFADRFIHIEDGTASVEQRLPQRQ
jgi:ABC-type lipoprotein export system ATPase subunit